jgi:GcrA cell cycle regulator
MEWTEALKERVRGLWPTHSARQIADEIGGFTRNAVVGKLNRMGLTVAQKTEAHPQTRIKGQGKNPKTRSGQHHGITRIIRGNGNSNHMRVISTRESADQYKLRCVEIVPRNLTLIELEPGDCRYPYGDETIIFCGHPVLEGSSYCAPHKFLCTRKDAIPQRNAA